jgi:hypothetical protein
MGWPVEKILEEALKLDPEEGGLELRPSTTATT